MKSSKRLSNLHFRAFSTRDLEKVDDVYQKYYSMDFALPNLFHTIGSGVVCGNDDIPVGFGMVKLYPEAIIILDRGKPKTTQGKALKLLFEHAKLACRTKGYKAMQAHTFDENYSNLLVKHFHFEQLDGNLVQVDIEE